MIIIRKRKKKGRRKTRKNRNDSTIVYRAEKKNKDAIVSYHVDICQYMPIYVNIQYLGNADPLPPENPLETKLSHIRGHLLDCRAYTDAVTLD